MQCLCLEKRNKGISPPQKKTFQKKSYALILTNMGWAKFWAISSQAHLVTLFLS
jgi:hypothetical protein